jgi:hypothetical protein
MQTYNEMSKFDNSNYNVTLKSTYYTLFIEFQGTLGHLSANYIQEGSIKIVEKYPNGESKIKWLLYRPFV